MPPIAQYPFFSGKFLKQLPRKFLNVQYVLLKNGDLYCRQHRHACRHCEEIRYRWIKITSAPKFIFFDECTKEYLVVGGNDLGEQITEK